MQKIKAKKLWQIPPRCCSHDGEKICLVYLLSAMCCLWLWTWTGSWSSLDLQGTFVWVFLLPFVLRTPLETNATWTQYKLSSTPDTNMKTGTSHCFQIHQKVSQGGSNQIVMHNFNLLLHIVMSDVDFSLRTIEMWICNKDTWMFEYWHHGREVFTSKF